MAKTRRMSLNHYSCPFDQPAEQLHFHVILKGTVVPVSFISLLAISRLYTVKPRYNEVEGWVVITSL